jgi:hypothetical protein
MCAVELTAAWASNLATNGALAFAVIAIHNSTARAKKHLRKRTALI